MAESILDTLKSYFTPELIGSLSSQLGENQGATEKALSAGIPTILAGLLNSVNSSGGADKIVDLIKRYDLTNIAGSAAQMLKPGAGTPVGGGAAAPKGSGLDGMIKTGESILSTLFGGKLPAILAMLASMGLFSGGTLVKLLGLIAPLILGNLGKILSAGGGGLSGQNLSSLLNSQKDSIMKAAPSGLANAMGLASLNDLGKSAATTVRAEADRVTAAAAPPSGLPGWLLPLLGLAALGAIAYFLLAGKPTEPEAGDLTPIPAVTPAPTATAPAATTETTAPASVSSPALTKIELPEGKSIELPESSPLVGLANFLKAPDATQLPKSFELPDVGFEGAGLAPAATTMFEKLADILKAFGTAKLKIVGYVKDSGNAEADKTASVDRAKAVVDFLVKAGVPADRLEADGQGSAKAFPIELVVLP